MKEFAGVLQSKEGIDQRGLASVVAPGYANVGSLLLQLLHNFLNGLWIDNCRLVNLIHPFEFQQYVLHTIHTAKMIYNSLEHKTRRVDSHYTMRSFT